MTLKSTSHKFQTRLETECEFLIQVTCCENREQLKNLIINATEEQIAAIIEVIANIDLFIDTPDAICDHRFDTYKIIPERITRSTNFRRNILNNWKLVRSILAVAADAIYLTEANKYVVCNTDDSVQSHIST